MGLATPSELKPEDAHRRSQKLDSNYTAGVVTFSTGNGESALDPYIP